MGSSPKLPVPTGAAPAPAPVAPKPSGPVTVPIPGTPVPKTGSGLVKQVIASEKTTISPEEMRNASRTTIVYGDSGLGKSTLLFQAAKWMFSRTGKPVRLVSVEASSQGIFQPLIDAGIVEPFIAPKLKDPLPVFRKLSYGFWPSADLKDWHPTKKQYAGYIWEGLTSTAECFLEDLRDKARKIGQDVVGEFTEGGEKFSNAAQSHYNFVQHETIATLKRFSALDVNYCFVSAHEAKGMEGETKAAIRGPGIVGSAKTDAVKKWCGTLLHLEGYSETVSLNEKVGQKDLTIQRTKRRAWFEPHPELGLANVVYHAKTTLPPDAMPLLLKKYPNGFFVPTLTSGLDEFLTEVENSTGTSADALTEWKKEIEAKFK